jgi:flagellar export protein FliJ
VRPFRFRAQPALDLRRREDDDARRACAGAESRLMAAEVAQQRARCELADGQQARAGAAVAPHEREWHRFWIMGLEQAVATATESVAIADRGLVAVRHIRQETRKRVDALEHFRDKARHAYDRVVLAEEQRLMDAAGTARFVGQRRALALAAEWRSTKEHV